MRPNEQIYHFRRLTKDLGIFHSSVQLQSTHLGRSAYSFSRSDSAPIIFQGPAIATASSPRHSSGRHIVVESELPLGICRFSYHSVLTSIGHINNAAPAVLTEVQYGTRAWEQ